MSDHAKPKYEITVTLPDGQIRRRLSSRRYTHVAAAQHKSCSHWTVAQWCQSVEAAQRVRPEAKLADIRYGTSIVLLTTVRALETA